MKHIVTLSLVFFSLTHLAKADRVEGLRIITERYCNKQQVSIQTVTPGPNQENDYQSPFFLSYSDLAIIGAVPQFKALKYKADNQVIADLTIRKKPKNNSP